MGSFSVVYRAPAIARHLGVDWYTAWAGIGPEAERRICNGSLWGEDPRWRQIVVRAERMVWRAVPDARCPDLVRARRNVLVYRLSAWLPEFLASLWECADVRLGRAIAGVAVSMVGAAAIVIALDPPADVMREIARWSLLVFPLLGVTLLLLATGPRRLVVGGLAFTMIGALALLSSYGLIGSRWWGSIGGATLLLVGARVVRGAVGTNAPDKPNATSVVRRRAIRSGRLDDLPAGVEHAVITAFLADVKLVLPNVSQDATLELDVTLIGGNLAIETPALEPAQVAIHRPFVLSGGALATARPQAWDDETAAAVTVTVVGLWGDVKVTRGSATLKHR